MRESVYTLYNSVWYSKIFVCKHAIAHSLNTELYTLVSLVDTKLTVPQCSSQRQSVLSFLSLWSHLHQFLIDGSIIHSHSFPFIYCRWAFFTSFPNPTYDFLFGLLVQRCTLRCVPHSHEANIRGGGKKPFTSSLKYLSRSLLKLCKGDGGRVTPPPHPVLEFFNNLWGLRTE